MESSELILNVFYCYFIYRNPFLNVFECVKRSNKLIVKTIYYNTCFEWLLKILFLFIVWWLLKLMFEWNWDFKLAMPLKKKIKLIFIRWNSCLILHWYDWKINNPLFIWNLSSRPFDWNRQ
jgi:hypothetical protein